VNLLSNTPMTASAKMYSNASSIADLQSDAAVGGQESGRPVPYVAGFTWRHAVTLLMLLVAVPTFSVAALACLPVVILAVGIHGLHQVLALSPAPRRIASSHEH
jgi:uncharacterized membrane protein (Fun14 family)